MNTYLCRFFWVLVTVVTSQGLANENRNFDRLFSSFDQRQVLNQLREQNAPDNNSVQPANSLEPALLTDKKQTRTLTVQGVVTRRSGSSVAWIDDRRWDSASPRHSGFSLLTTSSEPTQILLQSARGNQQTRLKPGQTLLLDSGRILELFENTNQSTGPLAPTVNKP